MQNFLQAIDERVLVCDGAMGTMLYARGIFVNRCFDELNLSEPSLVAGIHREYLRAGADLIETNTFGANRFKLAGFGLADEVALINRAGATLGRQAAAGGAWIAGSIGPLGVRLEPWGRTAVEEAEAAFAEQAQALADGGVDLFMLETFRDLTEILAAIRALRPVSDLPIVAQITTGEDGHTLDGTPPDRFTPALERSGADVIGLNCSVGPAAMLETIEAMARLTSARLSAQPNAGRPREIDGRLLSLVSPEYMASYARRFIGAGVRLVGGCCGTTPEHTREIAGAVRTAHPARRPAPVTVEGGEAVPQPETARREKSALARALDKGQFAILAEVTAPRGLDLSAPLEQARRFRRTGAVAVNVPDYPTSGARASALAIAVLIEQAGIEPLLQYTCRDRSLLGMQSDLVGFHAMGIRNLLLTTGTPWPSAAHTKAVPQGEVDAIGALNLVAGLNRGLDIAGQPLGTPTSFHAGAAVNPLAADLDGEWARLAHKIDAGAEFLVTPPVLDLDVFEAALPVLLATGVPVIAGVAVVDGLRHAEFLASEVTGVHVADRIFERLRDAARRGAEAEREEGLRITAEIAAWLRSRVQGLQITAFHGSARAAERVIADLVAHVPDAAPSRAQHG
jgi:homocysteine S-methyltransferase